MGNSQQPHSKSDFTETSGRSSNLPGALPADADLQELAREAFIRGEYADVVQLLEEATLQVPLSLESICRLADAYAAIGKTGLATWLFGTLLERPGIEISQLLWIASRLDELGAPEPALNFARAACQRDPESAQAWYDLGYHLGRNRHPLRRVVSAAYRAVHLEPDRVDYRIGLSGLLVRHGLSDEAFQLVRHLSQLQIAEIACGKCLRRVRELFVTAGDVERCRWCEERLEQLPDLGEGGC